VKKSDTSAPLSEEKNKSKKLKKAATDSKEKIKELTAAIEKEKENFLRLFAEFENYKKRTAKERIELFKRQIRKL